MTTRIPCCVPFCKRTAKAVDPDDPGEMICRKHGALVSKQTRLFMLRMRRKAEKAMSREPEEYTAALTALEAAGMVVVPFVRMTQIIDGYESYGTALYRMADVEVKAQEVVQTAKEFRAMIAAGE